jgi:hypothetical protein
VEALQAATSCKDKSREVGGAVIGALQRSGGKNAVLGTEVILTMRNLKRRCGSRSSYGRRLIIVVDYSLPFVKGEDV